MAEKAIVKWRWWYPEGCIQTKRLDEHKLEHYTDWYDGDEVAEEIVQRHIDENGTDGANNFEIEIIEPEQFKGIYDVILEWEPTTSATKRKEREKVHDHQG